MKDLKSGIEHIKQAKAHMLQATWIMSDCISKLKELEEENAGLRAKLEALIQSDDSYMKLPLDADGVPIRIGDVVYGNSGIAWTVVCLRMSELECKVEMENMPFLRKPDELTHKKPEPADSWEKLEQDVPLSIDDYWTDVLGREHTFCTGDKVTAKASDIVRRAKKLADIEELEGGKR